MRITFFIGGLIKGGAERVTCNMANFLVSRGHVVEILTMSESKSYPLDERVTRNVLLSNDEKRGIVKNTIKRYSRLKLYLKEHECDCYVVMLPVTTILLLSLKKYAKAPIISSERCYPAALSQITQRLLLLLLCKRAAGWVFQTPEAQSWYGKNIGASKTKIIPNAINKAFIHFKYTGSRKRKIVSVGRMCSQKNYPLLLKAFARFHSRYPDYKLLILGEGEKRFELESLIEDLDIKNVVDLPGFCDDIPSQLQDATLYILSSNYEGMPNTLMEAMALGVPCVATDCDGGGSRYLIEDGENGLLIPKKDVDALVGAMVKMVSNPDFAERCGRNAHRICERLAPEKIYGEWEKFIQEVVDCK